MVDSHRRHLEVKTARRPHAGSNTVSKYADMEGISPAAPVRRAGKRPILEDNGQWIEEVLENDLYAPRKRQHTAFLDAHEDLVLMGDVRTDKTHMASTL